MNKELIISVYNEDYSWINEINNDVKSGVTRLNSDLFFVGVLKTGVLDFE
jgi:hypothetical protein